MDTSAPDDNKLNVKVTFDDSEGIKITDWDVQGTNGEHQDIDIMVADRIDGQMSSDQIVVNQWTAGVKTEFRHKLSHIAGFKFYTNNPDMTGGKSMIKVLGANRIFIKKIEVNGLKTEASFKSHIAPSKTNKGEWSFDTGASTHNYVWYEDDNGIEIVYDDDSSPTEITATDLEPTTLGHILLIPQAVEGTTGNELYTSKPHINITYDIWEYVDNNDENAIKKEYTRGATLHSIHGDMIDMNKKITYTILFDFVNGGANKQQIYWAPSVVDWEDDNHNLTFN